ncbi:HYC_CC_PP family protein [Polaribacter sp. Hel1_85]|uniref:HYC_CC_PP family protein n=1 Tax=Polaribacter sp. Hel1_85 TaxID=1250005 RepID=UPI00052C0869|nr:hypothetical protein [Polaribacter sp. Hel1_85]KGL58625.1 hypothetical protein PHEL85_2889 [Polaribacter sp. Hel1_85]
MKHIISKIASFSLALLVLFSTFSFTVEKHYCGEFLMDVSFTGDADNCGMEMEIKSAKKKNCCKDEIHHIEGQDELQQVSIDDFDISKQQFLVAFHISFNDLFVENESKKTYYKDFSPPDIPIDYQVLYQSFLI